MEGNIEEIIQKEFSSFNIEEANKESIVSDECFEYIFGFENYATINDLAQKAREKAIDLGSETKFNKKYKIYRDRYIKYMKSKGGFKTNFKFDEDKNFKYNFNLECGEWIANQTEGVYKNELIKTANDLKMIKSYASPIPIFIAERIVNTDENVEKVRIAFYKDQRWQSIITEKNTISTKTKILQLANLGIEVNENNAKNLITYLADLLDRNVFVPVEGISHIGWKTNKEGKEVFLPYDNNIVFDGEQNFKEMYNSIEQKGDYEIWLNLVKELRNNIIVKFIMSCSFASPLIKILNITSYVVELWGISGTCKTVSMMVGMSIWGNTAMGKLTKTLNATDTSLIRTASFLHSIPLAADELQTIKDQWNNNFDKLIYTLCERLDRGRGQQFGGIEKSSTWNCNFLFTGEIKMTRSNSDQGAKNRAIEIEVKEKTMEDGNYVCSVIEENYGFLGEKYINKLQQLDKKALKDRHRELFNTIINNENTSDKQAIAMASIILASEITSKDFFNDDPLTINDVKGWLKKNEEIDQAERAYEWTEEWLAQNINRFNANSNNEVWGRIIFNGYHALIIKKVYMDELEKAGFDYNAIKHRLAEKGYLEKHQKRFDKTIKINGIVTRCVEIILKEKSDLDIELENQ